MRKSFRSLTVLIDRRKTGYLRARVVQQAADGMRTGPDLLMQKPRHWLTNPASAAGVVRARLADLAESVKIIL